MINACKGVYINTHYCISELAALNLPRWPTSRQGWHEIAARESWPLVEVKIPSGPKGVCHYYRPSREVMLAIAANTEVGQVMLSKLLDKYLSDAIFCGEVFGSEK